VKKRARRGRRTRRGQGGEEEERYITSPEEVIPTVGNLRNANLLC